MTASLTRRERRTLRDIEVHLAAEDPVLAGMLGCVRTARLHRRIRGVTRWIGGAAVAQLVLGLLLATWGPVIGALLTLALLPVLWLSLVMLDRWRR